MIPLRMLRHSAVLRRYIYGDDMSLILVSEVRLKNICIQLSRRRRGGKERSDVVNRGVMYFGCGYSQPEETELMADGMLSAVVWHGREYTVTSLRYIYCGDELHHIEAELGGTS